MLNTLAALSLFSILPSICSAAPKRVRQRCTAPEPCWPSVDNWHEFNHSISGQLIATRPSAATCHAADYNEAACVTARQNWTVSDWRTDQPGAYTGMLWEYGPTAQCFINTTREAPCQQGYVPRYSVNASSVEHIQKAIRFADKHDLLLVIKNTGHDHLGRSSGGDGLSIWTHNLKGMEWHDDFMPTNGPGAARGHPAVTLQAGEQWIDVYGAAAEQKRIVVGGHARTVGAAGGWLTGGGHSAWSNKYGLGIDNVLEINVVNADGEHLTLNQHTNPDHFWSIRGGGGCAWGVITSVTYRTHPEPNHIQAVFVQVNATDEVAFRKAMVGTLQGIDAMTAAGYTGYAYIQRPADATPETPAGFGGFFNQADGNNATLFAGSPAFLALNEIEGVSAIVFPLEYPSWSAYTGVWLQDPNVAQNVIDASRLLTPKVVYDRTKLDALIDMMVDYGAGFNFIGRVKNDTRADTAVHPAWAQSLGILSFGANWKDDAPLAEKKQKKGMVVEQSRQLGEIFGPSGGTYINEANPFEPEWQQVFWGTNYARLLKIKREIDPTNLFVCNRCVGTDILFEP